MQAIDKSGASPEELYELVSQDTPVVVWVTIGMANRNTPQGWYTKTEPMWIGAPTTMGRF